MSYKIEKAKKELRSALKDAGVHGPGGKILNAVNKVVEAHLEGYLRAEDVDAALADKNAEISRLKTRLYALEFLEPLNDDQEEFLNKIRPLNEIIDALYEHRIDAKTADEMCRALHPSDQT
jgi:hypothetical protein